MARKQEAGTAAVNAVAEAGPRRGTATRKAGQRTAAIIVDAALDVIGGEARVAFSLRAVAEQAGVSLANLQYYYPSRDDLLRAMFAEFGRRYSAACEAALAGVKGTPREHFVAAIRWNLEDITQRRTRQTFVRLWEMLASLDDYTGRLWGELYEVDIEQLAGLIRAMHPKVPMAELRLRATLLAAMIEGLMVVQGDPGRRDKNLRGRALAQALVIADGAT